MKKTTKTAAAVIAGVLAAGVLATSAPTAATSAVGNPARSAADLCRTTDDIPVEALGDGVRLADCDLTGRTIVGGLLAAEVPPKGMTVTAAAQMPADQEEVPTLEVTNSDDGVVSAKVEHAEHAPEEADDAAAAKAKKVGKGCKTSKTNPYAYKFKNTFNWHYQAGSTPKRYNKKRVQANLKVAAKNVAKGRNACKLKGDPGMTQKFVGRTKGKPGVAVKGKQIRCVKPNQYNVVGFKPIPGPLAVTCTWVYSNDRNRVYGSDVAIDKSKLLVLKYNKKCRNKYEIQGVMTHEFTHSAGWGHVNNNVYTMDPTAVPCSYFARTYTRAEFRGMMRKY